MNYDYLTFNVTEKKQILKYIFEEIKKNQNYEIDFNLNGFKKFSGNVVSDKEIFLAALKYKFSLSRSELEELCSELSLDINEVQDIFSLIKRDLEPDINKWFSEKTLSISENENVRFENFNIDVEESTNQVLDKSTIENQINNLTYLLSEYCSTIHHYDRNNELHIEYFFSEYELFKFVREYINNSLGFEDFIKQLQTIEFSIKELDEPVIILFDKIYCEETQTILYKINKQIIAKLRESDDTENDDDSSFGSLF